MTLEQVAEALLRGGVAVYPTETFYGLGAAVASEPALERLSVIKGRDPSKPFPLIAADRESALALWSGEIPEIARRLMDRFWPGPLTLVLPGRPGLSAAIASPSGVGIRVSPHPLARELASRVGPIAATSANLSGGLEQRSVVLLEPRVLAEVDAVLDGGETPGGRPSTVLAFRDGVPMILREGALSRAELGL